MGFELDHLGLCLRPTQGLGRSQPSQQESGVALPSWAFCHLYLPPTLSIAVGTNSDRLDQPMLFQTQFGQRPDQFSRAQPLEYPVGWRQITRVELIIPQPRSAVLQSVVRMGALELRARDQYAPGWGFDHEQQRRHRLPTWLATGFGVLSLSTGPQISG